MTSLKRWLPAAVALPLLLWVLVPSQRELSAVALHAHQATGLQDNPFDMAKPAGIARLRALAAMAPDRLDWRHGLARALEDAGRPDEAMDQWRSLASDSRATDDDLRTAARELIGHGHQEEGVALLEGLARHGRLDADALLDAAEQAGAANLWARSAHLLDILSRLTPNDPYPLELLARVTERQGDWEGAIAAWKRRFDLPGSSASQHLAAVALMQRLGQLEQALSLLSRMGDPNDASEWRERASLAWELGHAKREIEARRALVRLVPSDQLNRLALADRLSAEGDHGAADALYAEASAAADRDPDTLAELAARHLDGDPAQAAPFLAKLAALPDPPDRGLVVLAESTRASDPARSAKWLDELHARGGGDAASWLARGDVAARMNDQEAATAAWQRAVAMVPEDATDPAVREIRNRAATSLAGRTGRGRPSRVAGALSQARTWAVFYGSKATDDQLQGPDVLVLEPDQPWKPNAFRRPGQHVLAYVSLGEVHKSRSYYKPLSKRPDALASPDPRWPDAVSVDPRSMAWWGVVLEEVVPPILARGYDGLFLDTLDTAGDLDGDTGPAMANLVEALRGRFPTALLVSNGGLKLLPRTGPLLDAVAIESVFTDYQFQPPAYRMRAGSQAVARATDLNNQIRPFGLPVFAIEYMDPERAYDAAAIARQVHGAGWVPFVAPIGLDALPSVVPDSEDRP